MQRGTAPQPLLADVSALKIGKRQGKVENLGSDFDRMGTPAGQGTSRDWPIKTLRRRDST
jgi:hypothetical protein